LYETDGLLKVYKLSSFTQVPGEFNPVPEGPFLMPDPVKNNKSAATTLRRTSVF